MKTKVSILHKEYPAALRERVDEKLQDLFRFCSDKVSLSARLDKEKDMHCVEIVATVPNGPVLVADARAGVLRGALDEAFTRMTRKLKRTREKRTIERRRTSRGVV